MDRSQEARLSQESTHGEDPFPQESIEQDQLPRESTLSDYGLKWITERPIFSPESDIYNFSQPSMVANDWFGLQGYGSNFPAMFSSGIPNFSNSTNYSFGVDPDEPNRAGTIKATEVEETHNGVEATDVVLAPLNDTIKLPPISKPTEEVKFRSSSFLNYITSPEKIKSGLVPGPDKLKSGIVSATQQTIVDGSNRLNSNGGNEPVEDPFSIKKKLTRSDVGGVRCFLLYKDSVTKHMLPFLGNYHQAMTEDGGVSIKIYHRETRSEYQMRIQKCRGSYVVVNGWNKSFVRDMNLEEGDTMWLCWDKDAAHFCFSVLKKS